MVEALATAALVGVGIAGVYGGLGALAKGEARLREQDQLQRLAEQKYRELVVTETDLSAPQNGNFDDQKLTGFTWSMESEPSGVEDVQAITVKVEKSANEKNAPEGVVSGLVYIPPSTDSTSGSSQ